MKTSTYITVDENTPVKGTILNVEGQGRVMYLTVGKGGGRLTIQPRDPAFLDKLSNEADRLCREFVGDVPQPDSIEEDILRDAFDAYESEHDR